MNTSLRDTLCAMSGSLAKRAGALARVRDLASMSDDDRKRFAARAVAERDHEALWELTQAYLQLHGSSENTIRSYRKGVMLLLEAWQGVDLLRATRNDGQLYVFNLEQEDREADPKDRHAIAKLKAAKDPRALESAKRKPLSPASIRARISAARSLYRALRWAGVTTADPFAEVRLPKPSSSARERIKQKAFTEEELDILIHHAMREGDKRLLLILYLGAHAGLRVNEMLNLKWDDVDTMNRRVRVIDGKGGKDRTVRMSKNLTATLEDARNQRRAEGTLTEHVLEERHQSVVYRRVQRAWYQAMARHLGISDPEDVPDMPRFEGKGIHGMRHYTGVRLAKESRNIQVVRDHLGHSSVRSTEVYAGIADEAKEVDDW